MSSCILCRQPCFDGQLLSTGDTLHSLCLARVQDAAARAKGELESLIAERRRLEAELRRASTLAVRVWRIARGRTTNIESLRERIAALAASAPRLEWRTEQAGLIVEQVYNYWPDYPPDWPNRRAAKMSVQKVCSDCGLHQKLQVHHDLPIAHGGNHKPANLIVLCESCHRRRHGGREFDYDNQKSTSNYARNLEMLRIAIDSGRCVRFRYRKFNGERTSRRVRPSGLVTRSGVACVTGHCFLRNAERFFAIWRIRGIELSD